jgi:hypothetical protein
VTRANLFLSSLLISGKFEGGCTEFFWHLSFIVALGSAAGHDGAFERLIYIPEPLPRPAAQVLELHRFVNCAKRIKTTGPQLRASLSVATQDIHYLICT